MRAEGPPLHSYPWNEMQFVCNCHFMCGWCCDCEWCDYVPSVVVASRSRITFFTLVNAWKWRSMCVFFALCLPWLMLAWLTWSLITGLARTQGEGDNYGGQGGTGMSDWHKGRCTCRMLHAHVLCTISARLLCGDQRHSLSLISILSWPKADLR
jgi:hypothetical protein